MFYQFFFKSRVATATLSVDKYQHFEEKLLKAQEEVIDLQKRLVDVIFKLIKNKSLFFCLASTTSYFIEQNFKGKRRWIVAKRSEVNFIKEKILSYQIKWIKFIFIWYLKQYFSLNNLRILDLENKCETLKTTNKELENKMAACEEQIKVI